MAEIKIRDLQVPLVEVYAALLRDANRTTRAAILGAANADRYAGRMTIADVEVLIALAKTLREDEK
jgi:hypothetical protein